jgi:hypothetical protein
MSWADGTGAWIVSAHLARLFACGRGLVRGLLSRAG